MFGGRYLRQRTALGSESTALQTETTLGLPTGEKGRICGKNVINLLICWVFPTLFGKYFIGLFRLKIQRMQNAPPDREKKKRGKKKQTGKPRLNLTRSLQQGNSR